MLGLLSTQHWKAGFTIQPIRLRFDDSRKIMFLFLVPIAVREINASNLRGGETSEACFIKNAKSKTERSIWRENVTIHPYKHLHLHP